MSAGHYTYQEITTQTEAWADALHVFQAQQPSIQAAWSRVQPRTILVTGCGSAYYLASIAATLLQKLTRLPVRACPASEIMLFPELVLHDPANTLLLTISRSGSTTETLEAQREFRRQGGRSVWGISCHPEGELAQVCDLLLMAEAAQEKSLAQTRSFTTMLLLAQGLAATIGGEDVTPLFKMPALGRQWQAETQATIEQLGHNGSLQRFFFLGSGLQYAVACEAMLKMKEMSLSYSECYHFLELRHGPKAMVNGESLVVGLLSRQAWKHEQQLLDEMGALDGRTLALSFSEEGRADWSLGFDPQLPDWALPVLYLPPLQLLCYTRAIHNGVDPDHPRSLDAVVHLDLEEQ
jgi:glutamine---fructose-6-phosphate transaminase (isomerizing)